MPTRKQTNARRAPATPKVARKPKKKTDALSAEIVAAKRNMRTSNAISAASTGGSGVTGSEAYIVHGSMLGFDLDTTTFLINDTKHFGFVCTGRILASATLQYLQPSITQLAPNDTFLMTTGIACSLPNDLPTATNAAANSIVPMATMLNWVTPSNAPKWKTAFHCDYMKLYNAGIYPVWLDTDATSASVNSCRRSFSVQFNSGDTGSNAYATDVGSLALKLQMRVRLTWWDPVEDTINVTTLQNSGFGVTTPTTSAASGASSYISGKVLGLRGANGRKK